MFEKKIDIEKLKKMGEAGYQIYETTFPPGSGWYFILPDVGRSVMFDSLSSLMDCVSV